MNADTIHAILAFCKKNWKFIIGSIAVPVAVGFFAPLIGRRFGKSRLAVSTASADGEFMVLPRSIQFRYARKSDFQHISELANHFLGDGHGISSDMVKAWNERNKEIFRVVECRTNYGVFRGPWKLCGYYSVVPITCATYEHLAKGQIHDFQVDPSAISTFSDIDVPGIYVMDVMTADGLCQHRGCAQVVASALLRDLLWNLQRILNGSPHISEVSAIVATPTGKKIVKKSGFHKDTNYISSLGWERWILDARAKGLIRAAIHLGTLKEPNRFRPRYVL